MRSTMKLCTRVHESCRPTSCQRPTLKSGSSPKRPMMMANERRQQHCCRKNTEQGLKAIDPIRATARNLETAHVVRRKKGGRNRIRLSQLPSAPQGLRGIRLTSMTSMSSPLVSHVSDKAQAEVAFHLFYHPPQNSGEGTSRG